MDNPVGRIGRYPRAGRPFSKQVESLKTRNRNFGRYFNDFDDFHTELLGQQLGMILAEMSKGLRRSNFHKVIERCLLMTTDPGDLVLDPTCGGGTTAYVAEQWGRRWITIDTSRVAVALARQRLLTGNFDYYKLKNELEGVGSGFVNKTVPHITLRSIAQNTALDPIFAKHEPILAEEIRNSQPSLRGITQDIRTQIAFQTCGERTDAKGKNQ